MTENNGSNTAMLDKIRALLAKAEVTNEKTTIKFTRRNRKPIYGQNDYPPIGEWSESRTPIICVSGWHVHTDNNLSLTLGSEMWVVKVRGQMVSDLDKEAYKQIMFVSKVEAWDCVAFAQNCASKAQEHAADAADYAAAAADYAAARAAAAYARAADYAAARADAAYARAADYARAAAVAAYASAADYAAADAATAADDAVDAAAYAAADYAAARAARAVERARQSNYLRSIAGL